MNSIRKVTILIGFIGIIFGLALPASAGGGPAGNPACVESNPSGGALSIKATVAVWSLNDGTIDVALRLERSGDQHFYRRRILADVFALSDDGIVCQIFCTACNEDPAVKELVIDILGDFFGLEPDADGNPAGEIFITDKSVSDTDPDRDAPTSPRFIPGTDPPAFMTVAEVVLYVDKY